MDGKKGISDTFGLYGLGDGSKLFDDYVPVSDLVKSFTLSADVSARAFEHVDVAVYFRRLHLHFGPIGLLRASDSGKNKQQGGNAPDHVDKPHHHFVNLSFKVPGNRAEQNSYR